ncbi:Putative pilin/flagellin, contains class III signal peptide [Halorhabdus sp. SVX81]|uniref:DUF7310 family coiled-coil domain-containing protein n=1 Tax=Halorhabdus sp. SVX81 TaxID=2978283 RepID=UPI0023DBB80A|nr:hypothetical protein [Halorhabdus sp. SVX81]WEL17714.1 Putative pilin/flagellin, contains class III signal peptide [Halorhabdus sp. SVX81]
MTDIDSLEQRLAAIERTVVDGDHDGTVLNADAISKVDIEQLESRLDALDARVADLESTVQSIDGYVSNVESVNEDVERRADSAIATVDRLEHRLEEVEEMATETAERLTEIQRHGGENDSPEADREASNLSDQTARNTASAETATAETTSQEANPIREFVGSIRRGVTSIRDRLT